MPLSGQTLLEVAKNVGYAVQISADAPYWKDLAARFVLPDDFEVVPIDTVAAKSYYVAAKSYYIDHDQEEYPSVFSPQPHSCLNIRKRVMHPTTTGTE